MNTSVNQQRINSDFSMGPACALDSACNTVEVSPHSIVWMNGMGYPLFKTLRGKKIGTVLGMTIPSGKDAMRAYNRKFKSRTFEVTLNARGKGRHVCEGIWWDDTIGNWAECPKPDLECVCLRKGKGVDVYVFHLTVWNHEELCWDWVYDEREYYRVSNFDAMCNHHHGNSQDCLCADARLMTSLISKVDPDGNNDCSSSDCSSSDPDVFTDSSQGVRYNKYGSFVGFATRRRNYTFTRSKTSVTMFTHNPDDD